MSDTPSSAQLIYFADTMCSWCYGFAPEMNRVLLELDDSLSLVLQAGGLRPFHKEPMTDADKPRFRGYREQVQAATGQPFDWAFFDRDGYVMDTEPASRAVVTMRAMNHGSAYAYMHAIQRAYFAVNEDIRDPDILAGYAGQFDVDPAEFLANFQSDEMKQATLQDFALAQRFGVQGYPTLVLIKGKAAYGVSNGYAKADVIIGNIRRAMAHVPDAVS